MSIYPPIRKEIPPQRQEYDPAYFVGRDEEVCAIRRKIEEGQTGGPITRPVVHLWGAPGIGKSWLLQHIQSLGTITDGARKCILSALVDFSKLQFKATVIESQKTLLEKLTTELHLLENLPQESGGEHENTDPLKVFIGQAVRTSEHAVLILLFDAIEQLDSEDFFWLEREIIAPLARTDAILFIVAGRKNLPRWKEFSVRQRLEVRELRSFDAKTTQVQLERQGLPQEAETAIYPYTFGHPYANQVWGAAWEEGPLSTDRKLALLAQIEEALLESVTLERERDILRVLSTLRKFDSDFARRFLGEFIDPEFNTVSEGYYLRLFDTLQQTHLVMWSNEQRGYVIVPEVRKILQARLKLERPDLHTSLHQSAGEMAKQWLERYDGARPFPEILYHGTQLYLGEPQNLNREVTTALQTWLTPAYFREEQLDNLQRLIEEDPDLKTALPPALYDKTLLKIQQLKEALL